MKKLTPWILFVLLLVLSAPVQAEKVKYRKVQKVSFDGDSVDGVARNPYGAMLMQKKNLKFLPLYDVKKNFDRKIKMSAEFLR